MSDERDIGRVRIERPRPARLTARAMLAAFAAALLLAACGVKSTPKHPEGSVFPQQYPSLEDKQKESEGRGSDTQISPQGFPYEYPNRPPSR